jgi:hypothetical protein
LIEGVKYTKQDEITPLIRCEWLIIRVFIDILSGLLIDFN